MFSGVYMPYIRLDDDDNVQVDDEDNVTYTGSFGYHTVDEVAYKPKKFDPTMLTGASAVIYAMLIAMDLTEFHVRYDGGHDEGFAHADGGRTADRQLRSIESVVDELATPERIGAIKAAPNPDDARQRYMSEYYAKLAPTELVRRMLDELGDEMANCLLGSSYGTGEYSMYGAFVADLSTGELTDDASAQRPPNVNFD